MGGSVSSSSSIASSVAFGRGLWSALPAEVRALAASDGLDERMAAAWDEAAAAWPELAVTPAQLAEHVAARVASAEELEAVLAPGVLPELLLACACSAGDETAIMKLEARYFPLVAAALGRLRLPAHAVDEVLQQLRAHLFARRPAAEMGIASFRGRGALASWLKVSAVRMGGQLIEQAQANGDGAGGDAALARLPGASTNLEQQYARRWSKEAFEQAFAAALQELSDRDKALLRLHHIDGVSLEQLGTLYRTHRATVARWLAMARQRLLDGTRAGLAERHRLPLAECDSIIREAQSQLELTLRSLLSARAD
jgi:RNA polymerase sigma-70 factor (ECF subfamily)